MVMLLLDREFDAAALTNAEELDIRNIGARDWEAVLRAHQATRLSLYHITSSEKSSLQAVTSVRSLSMTWATKVDSIVLVNKMEGLAALTISDF